MAYPLEHEHKMYLDYKIAMNEAGKKALPKDEWRKRLKKEMKEEEEEPRKGDRRVRTTILSDG